MNDYIPEIIFNYLNGTATASQKEEFYSWINRDPENKKTYFEIKIIYDACKKEDRPLDIEESWQRLLQKKKKTPLYTMRRLLAVTASAAAITFLFFVGTFHHVPF